MSEQTNPEGSRRSNRDVAREMASLFGGEEAQEVAVADDLDNEEIEGAVEEEEQEAEALEEDDGEGEDVDTEDEETSAEFTWTLKVNGQEQTITDEDEARSLAQRGLHYTQEMQQLREQQRTWEGEKEQITAQLRRKEDEYAKALSALEQTFAPVLGEEPDWNKLYSENPEQYAHMRAQWDQLAAVRAEQQRIALERQQEAQKTHQKRLQQELDQLTTKLPEWNDPDKRKGEIEMIREYASEIGYSDAEIGQIWNHRDFIVLRDAARYRKSAAAGKTAAKKAAEKTVEPGKSKGTVNQKTRRYKQARKRARESGRVEDIAPLMKQLVK